MTGLPGDIMEGMTDRELISRAEALGVSASYLDSHRVRVGVPAETLRAILEALGEPPASDSGPGTGPGSGPVPATEPLPGLPRTRSWGFTVQLYSVRSRRSWGHGDLRDLADLARWSAAELGGGFILINPLHAAEPAPPVGDSPYLPMSRR
jgi:hypothetical protein